MNIRAKIFGGSSLTDDPLIKAKKPKGARAETLHSITVSREARRQSNSRGSDRHRLTGERAGMTFQDDRFDIELLNLSGGGAMVSGPFEPQIWDRVDLHLGEHGTIECAVRWIRDGRIGLEFAHETRLDCLPDQMAGVLRNVINRSFPNLEFGEWVEPEVYEEHETKGTGEEHRVAPRHPLIWSADLHHNHQTSRVRIRNISGTGAMIECEDPVRVGAEPMLELSEELSMSATVVWAVGDQVGLRFQSEFDIEQLATIRPSVAAATWSPPTYLDKAGGDSPWDPQWKRMGLKQLQHELEGYLKH